MLYGVGLELILIYFKNEDILLVHNNLHIIIIDFILFTNDI